jgi:hypothetical protein
MLSLCPEGCRLCVRVVTSVCVRLARPREMMLCANRQKGVVMCVGVGVCARGID